MSKLEELLQQKANHSCGRCEEAFCPVLEDLNAEIYAEQQYEDARVDDVVENRYHNHMR